MKSDNTILKKSDGTVDVKQVGDTCPLCYKDFRGAAAHIDMYTANPSCDPHDPNNNDFGRFFPIRLVVR